MPNQINPIPNNYSPRQIDDLIGVAPNWLLRSGITIVFIVVTMILILSAFIKYPDKIVAKGIMTSENPPIAHFNITAGKIEELYIENGDHVNEGQDLIYIKNNVNRFDLKQMEIFIAEYNSIKYIPDYLKLNYPHSLQLGEFQRFYSQLELAFSQFQLTLKQSGVFQQIKTIENEINNIRDLRKILLSEKEYSKEEMTLIERDFNRNILLNKEGVISDLDKEKVEGEWLRYQKAYSNLDQGIIQNKIREEQLILESQRLVEERASKVQSQMYDISQYINVLKSAMKDWETKYIIKAQIEGEVSLIPSLVEDQYVVQSTSLLSIIPSNTANQRMVRAYVASQGIGKINAGDKVIVKVNGYPYKEFGVLVSKVDNISELPEIIKNQNGEDSYKYTIQAMLAYDMVTSHQRKIVYKPNSAITAEIITKDKSILERLFETFLSLIK